MALAEQVVALPLVGGVDESTPSRLCSRLLVSENCRQIKTGALAKRYGTVCRGVYNARLGGGTPPTGELLCAYGNELVRVGSGHVDTFKAVGSTDYIYKGRASEALVYRTQLTSGESYITDTDVAVGSGFTVYVARSNAGALASGTASILLFVLDSDGAMVVPRTVLDSAASTVIGNPHVVIVGTTAIVTWVNAAGVRACTVSLTTLAIGAASTLVAGVTKYAAGGLSDRFAVLYEDGAGVQVGTWTSALAVQTAAVLVSTDTGLDALAVEGMTGQTLYCGWSYTSGGNLVIRKAGRNPATLAQTFADSTISSTVSTSVGFSMGLALSASGTSAYYVWSTAAAGLVTFVATDWVCISDAGAAITVQRRSYQVFLASKPAIVGGHLYALVYNWHSTHSTYFLVHLYDDTTPATSVGLRIVATVAPRQVPKILANYTSGTLASFALVSSGRYAVSCVVSGAIPDSFVASLLDVRIGATSPMAVEAGKLLCFSGGCPTAYDGASVAELGMAWEPDFDRMSVVQGAGGSMTPGTYYYVVVYEWRYGNGAIVRSIPSYPPSYTAVDGDGEAIPVASRGLLYTVAVGANLQATVTVPFLFLTNKQMHDSTANAVSIILYRTEADGATFYRASAIQIDATSINEVDGTIASALTTAIVDGLSDVDLRERPLLYTTGGGLPSEIPPSSAHVAVIGNRVWLSGTDDDSIWFSNTIVEGEAPTFSGTLTIAPFEGGRVVGMAELDEKKIIFKASGVYYVIGDGPGIDGLNGTISTPVRVPSDLGCADARSIVSTPQGVMFLSQNGLALLGRDLSVALIGKAVENSVASSSIVSADLVPDQETVRFAIASTMRTVEFDMFHGGAWGTNTYADPASVGSPTIVGATYCRGSWWHLTSEGKIFQEIKTSWLDVNGASSAYVQQRARLRYMSLGDLQGAARIWYVSADATRQAPHDLTIKLYIDHETAATQTTAFTALTMSTWGRHQAQVHVAQQECEGLSVEVYDGTPTGVALTTGEGFVLFGVSAEVGLEKPLRRLPSAQTG